MTVASSWAKAGPYAADGATREFPFRFRALEPSHVKVVYAGDAMPEYTVNLLEDGGTVVFAQPPPAGSVLAILRNVPITQDTDIQNNTAFFPEIWETALDKLTMICQQISEVLERCARLPETSSNIDAVAYLEELLNSCKKSAESTAASAQSAARSEQRAEDILAEIGADSSVAGASVSAHNMNPDAHEGHLLNLNGGTMRGMMRSEVADFFFRTVSDSHICFCGSKSFDEGASLFLLGQDVKSQWDTPGMFKIRAKAKDANGNPVDAIFLGTPDGFMSFKGRPIAFSVDGVGADGSGNVHLNALPKNGGEMTGDTITRNTNDSFIRLAGGMTAQTGASAVFYGSESSPGNAGQFNISATDGTNTSALVGKPDGSLTWNGKDVVCVASWKSSDGTSWYRKYSDGWIEQGGIYSGVNDAVITFNIEFTTIEYNPIVVCGISSTNGSTEQYAPIERFDKRTTITMKFYLPSATYDGVRFQWYACGF